MTNIADEFVGRVNPVSINLETLQYLDSMIKSKKVGFILEFGSGVSTEFWSEKLPDATVISFDNSRRYTKITRSRLNKKARNATVVFAPLRIKRLFGIHYITCKFLPYLRKNPPSKPFDVMLIDGPPGYLYAREATILQAYPYLDEKTLIIVDDAEREIEREMIERWSEMFKITNLEYHDVGQKQIATFNIKPTPLQPTMPKSPVHTKSQMVKLLFTFHRRNIMHNLWILKMRILNREPFPDQKMTETEQ